MKILNVIPIGKNILSRLPGKKFSYFTGKDIKEGALVRVPFKNKNIYAIVYSLQDLKTIKASVKKADFKLKPIKDIISENFLPKKFLEAAEEIAKYHLCSPGEVIKEFIPADFLRFALSIKDDDANNTDFRFETIMASYPKEERYQYYKSLIREEFAKGHSVFICLPSVFEIENMAKEIQRGIEKYTIVFHSKISSRKIKETLEKINLEAHPLLIIATKTFLFIPQKNIRTIILEEESSPLYKGQERPYLNTRKAVEIFCKKTKKRLIIGDIFPRIETIFSHEDGFMFPRLLSPAEQIIIDLKKEQEEMGWQKKNDFISISYKTKEIIKGAQEKNERVLLFVNRKGYSPITICEDCRSVISCERCLAPLVLHKPPGVWRCHKCLFEIKSTERCPYCKSWRLKTLGVGIEKILEELKRDFPGMRFLRIDSDVIKNKKQGEAVFKNFIEYSSSVLIGTELIFSYPQELESCNISHVAVISLDSLFSLPDFRINEKIFHILLKLRTLAKKTFLIQTRLKESFPLFENVTRGNLLSFYREEIESRKNLGYPPFKFLIKITGTEKDSLKLKKETEELKINLEKWQPSIYEAFTPKIKNKYIRHLLLKVEFGLWPDKTEELYEKLSSLKPSWKIDIDPETLL